MMDDLKYCPFCGAGAELRETSTHDYFVKCVHCGSATRRYHENPTGAAMMWNRRVNEEIRICKSCAHLASTSDGIGHYCTRTDRLVSLQDYCSRHREKEAAHAQGEESGR